MRNAEETSLEQPNSDKSNLPSIQGVTVSPEGYLNFATQKAFSDYLSQLQVINNKAYSSLIRSSEIPSIKGFESLSNLKSKVKLKSTVADETGEDMNEEMTVDEHNLMKAENLLEDPILEQVMDTTLRLVVGDQLFQITEYGTFSAPLQKANNLKYLVADFQKEDVPTIDAGESIVLDGDITFTNSFGTGSTSIVPSAKVSQLRATTSALYSGYNVDSYQWKHNSVVQKFWDAITGKDVTKENYFSNTRRVQVELFNVSYLFYASAGIKVKMQQRKSFLGIKYWKSIDCDKIAVGFEKVQGEMKYTNPRSFSSIDPTGSSSWSSFSGFFNGYIKDWVYTFYHNYDLVQDWVEDLYVFLPRITVYNNVYPDWQTMNKLYDIPAQQAYEFMKLQVGKYVYAPIQKQIKPEDPMLLYLTWGSYPNVYDKSKSFIRGVVEYNNQDSKTIRFSQSAGVNVSYSQSKWDASGYTPEEFDISEIDCFGAAYYDGEWKGIRFVK